MNRDSRINLETRFSIPPQVMSLPVGNETVLLDLASGRTGDWPPIGFSPRKANISLYFMCDHSFLEDQLARLGKHSRGVSCIYIKRLSDVDVAVLREMIEIANREAPTQSR